MLKYKVKKYMIIHIRRLLPGARWILHGFASMFVYEEADLMLPIVTCFGNSGASKQHISPGASGYGAVCIFCLYDL